MKGGSSFNKLVGTTNSSFLTVLRLIKLDESSNRLYKGQRSKADDNKLLNSYNQHRQKKNNKLEFLNSIYYTCIFKCLR